MVRNICLFSFLAAWMGTYTVAQQAPDTSNQIVTVVQGTLTAPGSTPFHLKAEITEGKDESPRGTVEMFWRDPTHWRREIHSDAFSQTMVVNGEKVYEQDSTKYFPLGLWRVVTAMVDPVPFFATLGPLDGVRTKANGGASESGITCYGPTGKFCLTNFWGLGEFVGSLGHFIEFTDYHRFHEKRIAHRVIYQASVGNFVTLHVTTLENLKQQDDDLFTVDHPTDPSEQTRVVTLDETGLLSLGTEKSEIIWPQVLDGTVTGKASFCVSIGRDGKVREVEPVRTDNERTNDSAVRQIMRWKFKPPIIDGIPAQVEGIVTLDLNTREYGPKDFLNDSEGRKLATNTVAPDIPEGKVPSGTVFKIWVAVDSDGFIIEEIILDGPPDLFTPCDRALHQWHFQPIIENGQPRPYRTLIEFRF